MIKMVLVIETKNNNKTEQHLVKTFNLNKDAPIITYCYQFMNQGRITVEAKINYNNNNYCGNCLVALGEENIPEICRDSGDDY